MMESTAKLNLSDTELERRIANEDRPNRFVLSFNAFDRVQFSAPVTAPTNSNFGQITSQANAPRSVQFAARLMW